MNNESTQEDQLAAAIAHTAILIPFFGAVIPLAIWLSQRERSSFLRFQALQALIYQMIGILAYFLVWGCQVVAGFGVLPLSLLTYALSGPSQDGTSGLSGAPAVIFSLGFLLIFGLALLVIALLCIGGPLFLILALVGSWRVLNGKPFHYPLIGNWVSRRLEAPQPGPA